MGYPKAYRDSLRWLSGFYTGEDDCPPYGCLVMRFYGSELCDPFGPRLRDGVPTWELERPGQQIEIDQNPAVLFFASEQGIKAGGFGPVTRDFPCLGLHKGKGDGLRPGMPCGPVADKFYLSSKGFAFTCMGHDDADPRVKQTRDFKNCSPDYSNYGGEHSIWVTNERVDPIGGVYFGTALSPSPVPAGKNFVLSNANQFLASDLPDDGIASADGLPIGVGTLKDGLAFGILNPGIKVQDDHYLIRTPANGLYDVSFSATLYAADAIARGTPLVVTLTVKRKGTDAGNYSGVSGSMSCRREQDIEKDNLGANIQTTKESAGFSGPLYLKKDDQIFLTNSSGCDLSMQSPQFSIVQRALQSFRRPGVTTSGNE